MVHRALGDYTPSGDSQYLEFPTTHSLTTPTTAVLVGPVKLANARKLQGFPRTVEFDGEVRLDQHDPSKLLRGIFRYYNAENRTFEGPGPWPSFAHILVSSSNPTSQAVQLSMPQIAINTPLIALKCGNTSAAHILGNFAEVCEM